jgi:flagellar motor switch protein FliN/FliY
MAHHLDPNHTRAVLAIQTPVSVTLARKKESLRRIIELVPGSMLTFDAHCDEPLVLEAGGTPIATGEAVKIGDKFGLRIREIRKPESPSSAEQ